MCRRSLPAGPNQVATTAWSRPGDPLALCHGCAAIKITLSCRSISAAARINLPSDDESCEEYHFFENIEYLVAAWSTRILESILVEKEDL